MTAVRSGLASLAFLLLAAPNRLRADNLDRILTERVAPELRQGLHHAEFEHKNIGVLPFRFQKGAGKQSFNVGVINTQLPDRLENALLLAIEGKDGQPLFNLIHRAGAIASATRRIGDWHQKSSERGKLFGVDYNLAWGGEPVKADAFLTGLVKLSADLKTTTLQIELFTRDKLKPEQIESLTKDQKFEATDGQTIPILSVTFPTDREILRSAGESFYLPAAAAREMSPQLRDEKAISSALARDQGQIEPSCTPENLAGLAIAIYYDDIKQDIKRESAGDGRDEYYMAAPKENQKVAIVVKHNGTVDDSLGFVLRVNGESAWQQQVLPADLCRPWILGPNLRMSFGGFAEDDKTETPWKVLSEEESRQRASSFGDRAGIIDLDVFVKNATTAEDYSISTYGLSRRLLQQGPAKDFKDLQARLLKQAAAVSDIAASRALIVKDPAKPRTDWVVSPVDFPRPVRQCGLSIRYYTPSVASELDITKN